MKIITDGTMKGGVGKTMLAFNLGGILAEKYKVLLIDADPHSNLSSNIGVEITERDDPSVKDIFTELRDEKGRRYTVAPEYLIRKAPLADLPNLDIIPSCIDLNLTEQTLISRTNREQILAGYIRKYKTFFEQYDYIFIDTHPDMNIITTNALYVADEIIMVSDSSTNAVEGCELFMGQWDDRSYDLAIENRVHAMVFNNLKNETAYSFRDANAYANAKEDLQEILCKTWIPESSRLKDATAFRMPINVFAMHRRELERQMGRRFSKESVDLPLTAFLNLEKELRERGVL